jgi:phosphoribosyl 1,2-cyclic phosphate phosphodiesterase
MLITFLGTGTSHGVPSIDCMLEDYARCPHQVCLKAQNDRRHRRTRASILIEADGHSLLIDTSQDLRMQMLEQRVKRIDAVLFSHGHADHIYGLPDIRSYSNHQGAPIDIYGSQETLDVLCSAFDYVFRPPTYVGGGIPRLSPHLLDGSLDWNGLTILSIPVEHGPLVGCRGYRMGDVAYIPDVKVIPEASLDQLRGLELLIINCLRRRPHASHLSLDESLAYVERLRPRRCLFTHMTHDIDYALEEPGLPSGVSFAYDGLKVTA